MTKKKSIYLITGIKGYIGSMIATKILSCQEYSGSEVQIIGLGHNLSHMENTENVTYAEAEIADFQSCFNAISSTGITPDYIIHCASPTKSAYMISNPVETIESIVTGTKNILEIAKIYNVKSMVYLSSMEAYGQISCVDDKRIEESEQGYIDILNVRSSYPLGKRMAENLCFSYYKEYDVPVKIARLAQTFGKGVRDNDTRVFVQFANAVKENKNIILHTKGDSMGNYCDIDDVVRAILLLLQIGESGEVYNVVNEENTMTIREMAEMVAEKVAHGKIEVVYDIPKENIYGYAAKTGLRLSSEKLKSLGWESKKNIEDMYRDMLMDDN